jgi:D-alanyl-D-alanine carboxypeptidase
MPHLAALRRAFPFVLALAALIAVPSARAAAAKKAAPSRPAASATVTGGYKGAVVMDAATGNILFEDNASYSGPPASMVKLMTFAVLNDHLTKGTLALDTVVKATAADTKIGGTQVWLKEHEEFPVEELLYAMMIQSANDAAYALARTAAGSVEAFVAEMNAKARELGMTNSTFRTPHGLPPSNRRLEEGDLTTPHDYALLCRHLILHTDVLKYTSVRERKFGLPVRDKAVDMVNHNNLLGKVAGVDGLKTGFTNGASFCLSATAQRNGRRVIVVVMGGETSQKRDLKVTELLERGFAALPMGGPAPIDPAAGAPLQPGKAVQIPLGVTRPGRRRHDQAQPAEAEVTRRRVSGALSPRGPSDRGHLAGVAASFGMDIFSP